MLFIGILGAVIGLTCWLIILINAFQDEVWKGLVGLICGLYLVYYPVVEFEHTYKWPITIGYLFGGALTGVGFQDYRV